MRTSLDKFLKQWWSTIFVVPLISALVILFSYLLLYPLLTYDFFHIALPSTFVIKSLAMFSAVLIPVGISKIYKISYWIPLLIWIAVVGLGLILDNRNYEGNPNAALAFNIFIVQLLALGMTIAWVSFNKKKDHKVIFNADF